MTRFVRRPVAALIVVALVAAGCASPSASGGRTVRVAASASLTEAFTALANRFERANPGVQVALTFAGSPTLVTQLRQGAPIDVLATADEESMARAVADGDVGEAAIIARNRLTVVVEPGNPAAIDALDDLAQPDLVVVRCAQEVPCGRLADRVLTAASAKVRPRSLEENVKAVVAKVALGEADAGLVFVTDARSADERVDELELLPTDASLTTPYPMAVTAAAASESDALQWAAFVRSAAGQQVLRDHGFLPA